MIKILLDMDGVLADFVQGTCDLHNLPNPYEKEENLGKYNLEELLGISRTQMFTGMKYEFWRHLKKLPEADQLVEFLIDTYGVNNICICSKPSNNTACPEGKKEWIQKYYPMFKNVMFTNAKHFCANNRSILVDDHTQNVGDFLSHGGNAVLVPRPWNLLHKHKNVLDEVITSLKGINAAIMSK